MDKNEWVYFLVVVMVMLLGMGVFHLISPEDRFDNNGMYIQMPVAEIVGDADREPRYVSEMNLIAGICALLLVGYLFRTLYRKFKSDSQADQLAMKDSLYPISLATSVPSRFKPSLILTLMGTRWPPYADISSRVKASLTGLWLFLASKAAMISARACPLLPKAPPTKGDTT